VAQSDADRKRAKAKAREAYRRQYEERRAKRQGKTAKVEPFDPVKFRDHVRVQSWASIHTIAFAAALTAALVLVGRAAGNQAAGAFAALLAIGSTYYYLLRVWGLDIRELRLTSRVGIWLTYFVTWIMASFLVANPPFIDDAPPEIHAVTAYVQDVNGTWVQTNLTAADAANNATAQVRFRVVDSSPIRRVTFEYLAPLTSNTTAPVELFPGAGGEYAFTLTNITVAPCRGGSYYFTIRAWDAADRSTSLSTSLTTVCP
jgi:hypothetical protein